MSCDESLTVSFAPACSALKKPAGFQNFGYIGTISDLASVTYATGAIAALTFTGTKVLTKFATNERQVMAPTPINDRGEGGFSTITHTVNLPIYFDTQAELNAAETVIQADKLFVILPTSDMKFRCYGLAGVPYDIKNFGLNNSGGEDAPGQVLNDVTRLNLVLTGEMLNLPQFFLDTDYATSLALLEGYLT